MWLNIIILGAAVAHSSLQLISRSKIAAKLKRTQEEVELLRDQRLSERNGRTKAERELRDATMQLNQSRGSSILGSVDGGITAPPSSSSLHIDFTRMTLPMKPIGILKSCFNKRCGTPRQPLLVPTARAQLTLRPELAPGFLDGLGQYSHCWVLYVFHENTDLQRLWNDSFDGIRAKIRVPRLNGARMGVFATRAPHRPCPIGLSVARIVSVKDNCITLSGADIVDGSPVLDLKPYVPFCDAVPEATTPLWVAPEAEEEPLQISSVELPPEADVQLEHCWDALRKSSLYTSYSTYKELVLEVLSRDIRSVTQRIKVPARQNLGVGVPSLSIHQDGKQGDSDASGRITGHGALGKWHVVLDGIDVSYDVDTTVDGNVVFIRGGVVAHSTRE